MKKTLLVLIGAFTVTAVYACYNHTKQTACPDTYTCSTCTSPKDDVCTLANFGSQYDTPEDDGSGNSGLDSKKSKHSGDCTYDCSYGNGKKTDKGEEATGKVCPAGA